MKSNQTQILKEELKSLYKSWPSIGAYLKGLGRHSSNAEDFFQEALVIFLRKRKDPNFELTVEPVHYIKGTCRFIWYNQARKDKNTGFLENPEISDSLDSEWLEREQRLGAIDVATAMGPSSNYTSFKKKSHRGSVGGLAVTSTGSLLVGCSYESVRACKQIEPSLFERFAPYFKSPLIIEPIVASWHLIW